MSSLQSNSCNEETNVSNEEVDVRWDQKIGPVSMPKVYRMHQFTKMSFGNTCSMRSTDERVFFFFFFFSFFLVTERIGISVRSM